MTNDCELPDDDRPAERRVDPRAAGAVPPTGGTSLPGDESAVHES
jgi:hypothetical protein